MTITSVLLKKHLFLNLDFEKADASLKRFSRVSGRVLQVAFNIKATKFEITDYIKVSKKHRSNVVDILVRDIFQYNFTGICICQRKDPYTLNTSFLIRNVFDQFPYELHVPLYSPIIDFVSVLLFRPKIQRIIHSKYYYLRQKPLPMSKVQFDYIIGMYSPDIVYENIVDPFLENITI